MARVNVTEKTKAAAVATHEGGKAVNVNAVEQLRRSVLSCLLWESEFYEDGQDIAARIGTLCKDVAPAVIAELAIEARERMHLRHVPLLLAAHLCRKSDGSNLPSETIARVIQRADELAEFCAVYAKVHGVDPKALKGKLSKQAKRGLAAAFQKFDEYAFAKYNREAAVKLRDVLFLCHAKPPDVKAKDPKYTRKQRKDGDNYVLTKGEQLFKRIAEDTLVTPDTWEVALSAGADKRETFERLITNGDLGYFALLRNLRNMVEAGCNLKLVADAIRARGKGANRVLPFRYIAAARYAPALAEPLNEALLASIDDLEAFDGVTVVLVDVSHSMDDKLSARSDMTRADAAAALAAIWPGEKRVFTFSEALVECQGWKGLPGIDAILRSQAHMNTYLARAIHTLNREVKHDRLVVITDEQSHDGSTPPRATGYLINMASARNGVGYPQTGFVHIDGWSENVIRYIHGYEKLAS